MRLLVNRMEVKEIVSVEVTPCYKQGDSRELPSFLFVTILEADMLPIQEDYDERVWRGQYMLDGTMESYRAALKNWDDVKLKLLEKGFCKLDDFENVDWD